MASSVILNIWLCPVELSWVRSNDHSARSNSTQLNQVTNSVLTQFSISAGRPSYVNCHPVPVHRSDCCRRLCRRVQRSMSFSSMFFCVFYPASWQNACQAEPTPSFLRTRVAAMFSLYVLKPALCATIGSRLETGSELVFRVITPPPIGLNSTQLVVEILNLFRLTRLTENWTISVELSVLSVIRLRDAMWSLFRTQLNSTASWVELSWVRSGAVIGFNCNCWLFIVLKHFLAIFVTNRRQDRKTHRSNDKRCYDRHDNIRRNVTGFEFCRLKRSQSGKLLIKLLCGLRRVLRSNCKHWTQTVGLLCGTAVHTQHNTSDRSANSL